MNKNKSYCICQIDWGQYNRYIFKHQSTSIYILVGILLSGPQNHRISMVKLYCSYVM